MRTLLERFLDYVRVDTTSSEDSESSPSTLMQLDLQQILLEELSEIGAHDIHLSEQGVLYASLPGGTGNDILGLIAHVDTSPEAPGNGVKPVLHQDWDGKPIELGGGVVVDPDQSKDMNRFIGGNIVTSDGTTLLGADDKAGVAIIMDTCRRLMSEPSFVRPQVRIAFTPDEEVGRGVLNFELERFGAALAYTVDGGCLGYIDSETFNAYGATWTIEGREVHPGSAKGVMINAVRLAAELVSLLRKDEMPESSEGKEGYIYPLSIDGTTGRAKVRMILRDFREQGMKRRIHDLETIRDFLASRYEGAVISLELKEHYRNPSDIIKSDRRLVEYAMEGSRRAGVEPREGSIRGGTDGSRLSYMGLPTVNLPTGGEMFHSRTEWIAEEGLKLAADTLMETLKVWGEHC